MKSKGRHHSEHAAGKGHKPRPTPSTDQGKRLKMMGLSKKPKQTQTKEPE